LRAPAVGWSHAFRRTRRRAHSRGTTTSKATYSPAAPVGPVGRRVVGASLVHERAQSKGFGSCHDLIALRHANLGRLRIRAAWYSALKSAQVAMVGSSWRSDVYTIGRRCSPENLPGSVQGATPNATDARRTSGWTPARPTSSRAIDTSDLRNWPHRVEGRGSPQFRSTPSYLVLRHERRSIGGAEVQRFRGRARGAEYCLGGGARGPEGRTRTAGAALAAGRTRANSLHCCGSSADDPHRSHLAGPWRQRPARGHRQAAGPTTARACGCAHGRLQAGSFAWPREAAGTLNLKREQLDWLVAALPWQRLGTPPPRSITVIRCDRFDAVVRGIVHWSRSRHRRREDVVCTTLTANDALKPLHQQSNRRRSTSTKSEST
jgi:hypothetical protein